MVYQTPKTDWVTNPINPRSQDFNRIEGNIAHVLQEIEIKKGSLVDAINFKKPLVDIESSYAEMEIGIKEINKNPRMKSGTGVLEQVSARRVRLTVSGLGFRPSRVFVRGDVTARHGTFNVGGATGPSTLRYDYGIVNGVLRPASKTGIIPLTNQITTGSVSLSCAVSYNNDGFVVTVTGSNDLTVISDSSGTQHWFAYEMEG